MTRGRSGNQTYTGFNGASDHQLRTLRLSDRSEPNRQNRKLPPSQHAMRRAVEAGMCPFCGDQFQNIAAHTNRTHGVDANELKDLMGIPRSYPVCSPDLSEKNRKASKMNKSTDHMEKMRSAKRNGKRNLSESAKQLNREKLNLWRASTGDGGERQRLAASRESKRRIAEKYEPIYQRAFALIHEGYMLKDVASHVGISKESLSRKWRERYPDIDLRSVRHQAKRLEVGD